LAAALLDFERASSRVEAVANEASCRISKIGKPEN
jgi:hypothetical protein